jgi:hypothetical protein
VKLAESFHGVGMRIEGRTTLDRVIREMIAIDRPVIVDCAVDEKENVMPMIPSGAAHNEMLLGRRSGKRRWRHASRTRGWGWSETRPRSFATYPSP